MSALASSWAVVVLKQWRDWQNPMPTLIVRVYECSGVFLSGRVLDAMARLVESYADIDHTNI